MIIRDRIAEAPEEYRRRPRTRAEVRADVLHQTSFTWRYGNPMWTRVRAHAVVHQGGQVTLLHSLLTRMRYGCGLGNAWAINIEIEGNLPLGVGADGEPVYYKPEKFGRSVLTAEQVESGRELLAWTLEQVPGLMIGAHRQIELDRSGCCGPDIWASIGQYGVDVLGMPEMPVAGGRPIPDSWREPVSIPYTLGGRAYAGPLEVDGPRHGSI